jgi:hypothetical protein
MISVQKNGKQAQGRFGWLKAQKGEKLSWKQSALGKCYDCMCGYIDGKIDCQVEKCPLYWFMPYRQNQK